MPELPEVETLRRELNKALKNKKIISTKVLWPKTIKPLSVRQFKQQTKDKTIKNVHRQAKILIINLTSSDSLVFHLKMTGQLIYHSANFNSIIVGGHPNPKDEAHLPNNHTRLIINFSDHSTLFFNDLRKFGWVKLVNNLELQDLTKHLGVEPLSKFFTNKFLTELFKKYPNRTLKQILLDQTLIAGIGNIYADESAFATGILPNSKINTIKPTKTKKLQQEIVKILELSIKMKGTSSRNYRRSNGELGGFVPYLNVYGRAKQPCKVCGTPIEKIKHAGRGTHFCPKCQK